MTPNPQKPSKSTSGNPAAQQTIKQQRAAQREAKVAAYKREQARKKRNKRLGIGAAVVGGVAVLGVLTFAIIASIPRYATYTAGTGNADIDGVETFTATNNHTTDPVSYEQNPPAGGDHNPVWLNCGIYTEPQVNENAVHSLEHGAVWVTYDPSISDEELSELRSLMPSTYAILSPYEGMDTPITISAWGAQLKVDSADDARIPEFFENYWRSDSVPEPGAACVGGVTGEGKA
ncbi:MAG: DUF3105 domain-containing protein [Mycetocola sp.]